MSPFLSPRQWQDAIAAHKDLRPVDRLICSLLWLERTPEGLAKVRHRQLAEDVGIKPRYLRARLIDLESLGIIRRMGSDNDGSTFALVGGSASIPSAGTSERVTRRQKGRFQNSTPLENPSDRDAKSEQKIPKGAVLGVLPPEEYKNITLTLEPLAPKVVPAPTNLKSPPSPLIVPNGATNGTDLLGLPLADDESALLREAVETWQHWQKRLGKRVRIINLTPKRLRRFTVLWRGPLNRSMTAWRKICRACVRNALLAGVEGRWDGATFDWVMLEDNAARILRGEFAEDYDPAPVLK